MGSYAVLAGAAAGVLCVAFGLVHAFRGRSDGPGAVGPLAGGLLVEVVGLAVGLDGAVSLGRLEALAGAVAYAYLIAGLLCKQRD